MGFFGSDWSSMSDGDFKKLSIALNLYLFDSDLQASSSLQDHIKNIPEHFRRIFL